MNKLDTIRRGESAQHLLSNPIAMAALDDVQNDCFLAWGATQPDEAHAREFAYQLFLAVKLLRGKLQSWGDDARVEMSNAAAVQREQATLN